MSKTRQLFQKRGFTIVELLIVVVVIAILAAITIIAYNGVSNQAKEATLKSDLETGAKQIQLAKINTGSFPSDTSSLKKSESTTFQYTNTSETFCLGAATNGLDTSFYVTEAGAIKEGTCPFVMQTFTTAQCAALTVYTGANPSAVVFGTDLRGAGHTYQIARLADGHCWMLDNLKLGSASGTLTLTPSDTNISANFVLPKLTTANEIEFTTAKVYGPIPGDSGSGATNYGYFYNWFAATAGETPTSLPAGGTDAVYSICPASWRLPSSGLGGDFVDLDIAFGGTGSYAENGPSWASWQPTGAFKGVFAGGQYASPYNFNGAGSYNRLWSRTPSSTNSNSAYILNAEFGYSSVDPASSGDRSVGFSVRCVAY